MTRAGEVLAAEIRSEGPVSFARFMEVALYHPEHGYYRRRQERFGRHGDFYTAEQVQPVFGILVAAHIRRLWRAMDSPADFTVVELGAGRGEMAQALSEWRYVAVDLDSPALPDSVRGVVFSNEFFDALPVEVLVFTKGEFREQRVGIEEGRFVWSTGPSARPEVVEYLGRYAPEPAEGRWYEAGVDALSWMGRIGRVLREGWVLTIDYGVTRTDAVRFPRGTLMSYRRHTAIEAVLDDAGAQDITAHVNFTALAEHGAACGLGAGRLETLTQFLLDAGAEDQFAGALASGGPAHEQLRRLQLKTLLVSMGEVFRVLWQRVETGKGIPERNA